VAHSQQMVRFDREDRRAIGPETETEIIKRFADALAESDTVVISDYEKGLLTPRVLRSSIEAAHARDRMVCLDPKLRNWSSYEAVDVITPNQLEAERATGIELVDDDSILAAAARIRSMLAARSVLLTRGEHGMSLLDDNGRFTNIPTVAREVYDVTGAGDTVIATLSLSLAAGASLEEAAIIANHAAGIVVGKVGTAGVTGEELRLEFRL
jgi:D-beta-D-heptose 7-phosphate kinase/D-beta-D-heptose 1-phosphate adenosyltransferase